MNAVNLWVPVNFVNIKYMNTFLKVTSRKNDKKGPMPYDGQLQSTGAEGSSFIVVMILIKCE